MKLKVNEENMELFWRFVVERQNIWYKRFVLNEKQPWTEDIILKNNKFTNVYRILDRNTQFLLKNIKDFNKNYKTEKMKNPNKDIIFNIILFRIFNRIDIYQKLQSNIDVFNPKKVIKILQEKEKNDGRHVFCDAYMTTGSRLFGYNTKIENYVYVIDEISNNIEYLYKILSTEKDMEIVWEYITQYKGIGGFLAQQLCVDFSYLDFVKFDNDQWTFAGNGANGGLSLLFENNKKSNNLKAMKYLRDNQFYYLKKYNLFFKEIDNNYFKFFKHCKKGISLNDIENCCCEFYKYYRLKNGKGKIRVFRPKENNLYGGNLDN